MPLTVAEGAMLGLGMVFAGGATFAYKRKQTTAFKLAYFMAWPTLGSAALWVLMPDQQQMEKQLKDSGYSQRQLDASRAATQAQLAHLRAAAESGRARREGQ